ncbi:MAG: hypothetical protein ABEJ03_01770 [Candidatus Nanohaloarchaea archaeon]
MKVYSLSGSVIRSNLERIGELSDSLTSGDERIIVVTGAGGLSKYQDASSGTEGEKDLIGIKATRVHAKLLATEIDGANSVIPGRPDEVQEAASNHENVVTGGLVPGYSTDAVAATVAELLDADLYLATTVDGVYTEEPEREESERLEEVSIDRLRDLVSGNSSAGGYDLIDSTALDLIERSEIKTRVFRGSLENISSPDECSGTDILV